MTGAATANFVYDADGKQIKAIVNGITAVYVGNHYEVKNNIVTKYYFAGSTRLAVRTGGSIRFLLGDHLGSSSVTTNVYGAKTASALYKAFGETRFTSGTLNTDYKFTGQREESALGGIYWFSSRWFDPTLGRFMSPDSIIPTSQGTQAYDRYAFVNNNPVRYTDPTGHMCREDGQGCDGSERNTDVRLESSDSGWVSSVGTPCATSTLMCVVTTESTEASRKDLADDLILFDDLEEDYANQGDIAGGIAAAIAGIPAGIIVAAACSAVIPCVAGVAIATAMVMGAQYIAGSLFGGTAAGIYHDASVATNSALQGSKVDTFTVSSTTVTLQDSKGNSVVSNTFFNISGGGYSTNFTSHDRDSFFVNPISVVAGIFGFSTP